MNEKTRPTLRRGLGPALAALRLPGVGAPFAKAARTEARRHIHLGDTHRTAARWAAARDAYAQALALDPGLLHIWVQYGHALKECGEVGAAIEAYRRSLALDPSLADTHLQLGHALKLQGRLPEALSAYEASHALDSHSPHAAAELRAWRRGGKAQVATSAEWPAWVRDQDRAAVAALLDRHGLAPGFLQRFDPAFYAAMQRKGLGPDAPDPLRCVRHFCEAGLAAEAAINDRDAFDAVFHAATYPDPAPRTRTDAYRYWLNAGLVRGEAPNLAAWIRGQGIEPHDLDGLDLPALMAANPDLAALPPAKLVANLLDGGLIDAARPPRPTPANAQAFVAVALRAAVRKDAGLALEVLERLLAALPDHGVALAHYADRLMDEKQHFAAAAAYRQVMARGEATQWTYALLGQGLLALDLAREAYEVLAAGAAAFPQYPQLVARKAGALDRYFHDSVREYETVARLGRIADGQGGIAEYCRVAAAPVPASLPPRPIRAVALFALRDLAQCRFYRVDQKVEHLQRAGYEVEVFDSNTGHAEFMARLTAFQAVIFYRVAPLPGIIPCMEAARALGLVTFYEIDDLLFLPEEYPGTLESYAGQITAETFNMLAMGVPLFAGAMRMCDYALASTPMLARAMEPFVGQGRAFVHRNGMGSGHEQYLDYQQRAPQPGRPVVLFYGSGTRAHKADYLDLLEPALIEVARRHGARVAIVLVGWLPVSDALRAAAKTLVVVEPVFDLHEYWAMLQEADINLAVLSPSLNVDCKSEIKWMEAGMFGIPSVVSRTATYAEVIEDGQTGFMCATVEDWTRTLDRLVRDAPLRQDVGRRAQEVVRAQYCIDAMARSIGAVLQAVSPAAPPRKRRVLLVNVFYPPQTYGGATRVLRDNVAHVQVRYGDEFEFEAFTCIDEAAADYVETAYAQDGVRVTAVSRSVEGERMPQPADPRMGEAFRRCLAAFGPDLVHFHCIQRLSAAVVDAAREAGMPYLITVHDGWWISDHQFLLDARGQEQTYDYADPLGTLARHGRAAFARMQALRPALFGARHVLAVSEPFAGLHARCGVPNVRALANGVSALPPCVRTASADGRLRLGHIGGTTKHKGYNLLKYALMAGSFPNLGLLVVNHFKPKGYEHREVWGATPVRVVGKVAQSEVTALYGSIDVLVAPSLWAESFGLVTREAQACGCWVVASDRGAIGGDVIEGVNGHVVDVSGIDGLLAVLARIDADPARYLSSPPPLPLRSADEQGDELAALYRSMVA